MTALLMAVPAAAESPDAGRGVVAVSVEAGLVAERAGLAAGDVLLSWRDAATGSGDGPTSGTLRSPFDLERLRIERAPLGTLELVGRRGDGPLEVELAGGRWGLEARPAWSGEVLADYERGLALLEDPESSDLEKSDPDRSDPEDRGPDAGAEVWRVLASELESRGELVRAGWLRAELGHRLAGPRPESSEDDFTRAIENLAAGGETWAASVVHDRRGAARARRHDYQGAEDDYLAALDLRRQLADGQAEPSTPETRPGESLGVAHSYNLLGQVAVWRGDLEEALRRFEQCRDLRRRLAPDSLDLAGVLNNLGLIHQRRGELDLAEQVLRRALEIGERRAPESIQTASSLNNLGLVAIRRGDLEAAQRALQRALDIGGDLEPGIRAWALNNLGYLLRDRGDLASSEDFLQRALEVWREAAEGDSPQAAATLNNLGLVAADRKDYDAAEGYFSRAHGIWQELAPESLDLTLSLNNLGNLALESGDLEGALARHRRALEIRRQLAPESLGAAQSYHNVGRVLLELGEPEAADEAHRQALAIKQKLGPESLSLAHTLHQLGEVAAARGDLEGAEGQLRRALEIRQRLAPGSTAEAESCHHLALLHERRGEPRRALEMHARAVAALEAQRARLGGADEVRSGFADRYAVYYRRHLELLLEQGLEEQAFEVLERYRARSFLALLAERDLLFEADVPADLDRERRIVKTLRDRLVRELFEATDPGRQEELRGELAEVRRRSEEVAARIRAAAPRLAALESPQPLDLEATRRALDPGTLLLSYSVGPESSHLFTLTAENGQGKGGALEVHEIDLGAEALGRQVERLRGALESGRFDPRTARLALEARRLGEAILAPAKARIDAASRLLILPDGPLHVLPFAALAAPGKDEPGSLVAGRPLHVAASATVFEQLKRDRRAKSPGTPPRLYAFGDPSYPVPAPGDTRETGDTGAADQAGTASATRLEPLPATRREVTDLAELFPDSSRVFLGARATEEKVKEVAPEADLLHLACHAYLDHRSPLDSGLALSLPSSWRRGGENGLLQAWEIFEQLRIDADLVTLSACDTGLGKLYAGEGLLGLTRAFHYAGARSVLASLWSVSDRSTGELMRRFYTHLRGGASKDEALRRAQLELAGSGRFAHPFHWAGFELIGDRL